MIIEEKTNTGVFGALAHGDVFKFSENKDHVFLKSQNSGGIPTAVNLRNGYIAYVKDTDPVILYPKAKLKLQGD